MKPCPFCAKQVQDDAVRCRHCGEFLDGRGQPAPVAVPASFYGYEYKSRLCIGGLPLVHIASGFDTRTLRPRVARGWIAVGSIAYGVVLALGSVAFGGIAVGGVAVGLAAFAGVAIGGLAVGGCSLGAVFAAGGVALSLRYAVGGLAVAPYVIGSGRVDPVLVEKLKPWVPAVTNLIRGMK